MATKKDLMIVVIATFCLMAILFSILPVGSQNAYDPWLDTNDDGWINSKEAVTLGAAFSTFGDPTKNVSVTNWPAEPEPKTILVCANYTAYNTGSEIWLPFTPSVEGYRYVSIFLQYTASGTGSWLWCCPCSVLNLTSTASGDGIQEIRSNFANLNTQSPNYEVKINLGYEARAPYLSFQVGTSNWIRVSILLYCYN